MSLAHRLIDGCMFFVCVIWLIQFLAEHSRLRRMRRNAWADWRTNTLLRRQGD